MLAGIAHEQHFVADGHASAEQRGRALVTSQCDSGTVRREDFVALFLLF
jgi:hypothetical protein